MTLQKRFSKFPLGKRQDADMTEGSIVRHLILFSIPLLVGNIFQQLYSMVDMYIVGHTVSTNALGAISCTGSISGLLISFAQGLTSGFCVILAQHFGAGRREEMRRSFITGIILLGNKASKEFAKSLSNRCMGCMVQYKKNGYLR